MAGPSKRKPPAAGKGAKKKRAKAPAKAKPAATGSKKKAVAKKAAVKKVPSGGAAKKAAAKKAVPKKAVAKKAVAKKAAAKKPKPKAAPAKAIKKAAPARGLGTKTKATASTKASKPATSSGRRALNASLSLADRAARGARSSVQTLTADKSRRAGSRSSRPSQEIKSQNPRTVRATRSVTSGGMGSPQTGPASLPPPKPSDSAATPHDSADVLALEPTQKAKAPKATKAAAAQPRADGSDAPKPKARGSRPHADKVDLHIAPREFLATLQDDDDEVIKPQD